MPPKKGAGPDDSFVPAKLQIQEPNTLVIAMGAPEAAVAGAAAMTLERFADLSDRNKAILLGLGALAPAAALLANEDPDVRAQAACFFYTMTNSYDVRQAIRKQGLVVTAPMLAMLTPESGPVQNENASGFFANMCNEYSSRVELGVSGIEAVVTLFNLSAPDPNDKKAVAPPPDIPRNLCRVLMLCMAEYDTRAAIGPLGAIESMLLLLDSPYNEIQSLALQCIQMASKNKVNRKIVQDCGALPRLLEYCADEKYAATHCQALETLGQLLHDPEAMEAVAQRGPIDKANPTGTPPILTKLIDFIKSTDQETRCAAMLCVAQAAQNKDNRRRLMDQHAEEAITQRLWSDDPKAPLLPRVALAAALAVTALAQSISNAEDLGGLGAVARLVKLMTWDDVKCNIQSVIAAAAVTAEVPKNRELFVEAEGVPKLMPFLTGDDVRAATAAALCIYHLSLSLVSREPLSEIGPIPALAKGLESDDTAYKVACATALNSLCADAMYRSALLDAGPSASKAVVALCGSPIPEVRTIGSRLVRACGVDRSLCIAFCDVGGLDCLQKSALAVGHMSPFASAAYSQLLDQNLSAKYSVRNRIEVGDVINELFFDAGRTREGAPYQGLSELGPMAVDGRRPILLVNLGDAAAGTAADTVSPVGTRAWVPPIDPELVKLATAFSERKGCGSPAALAVELAKAVANRMGGAISLRELPNFGFELALTELKISLGTNVVPIGLVTKGIYYHRALLFKVLADQCGVQSALVRGEYNRAYNVIYLPEPHVVDVMHEPGTLTKLVDVEELNLASNFFENFSARPHS